MNPQSKLQALLFIHGEPITFKKAMSVLNFEPETLKQAVLELGKSLESENSGLTLILEASAEKIFENKDWVSKKIQLATKPELSPVLSDFIKEEIGEDLTPASLEVASIVAYLGPISRAKIEYIRGVNSVFTLRNLLMRGLVERISDSGRPNAILYQPTFDLLKHLGVNSKTDLPEYERFQALLKDETKSQ